VARKELKVYFFLPHVRSVPVKVGLVQADSGSGLLTRPSSETALPDRRRVTRRPVLRSSERRGQETLAERKPLFSRPTPHASRPTFHARMEIEDAVVVK